MRGWILLIAWALATAGYIYQIQFQSKPKPQAAAPTPTPEPTPLVPPEIANRIQAFLSQARLRSTLLGPPDIAIIDGREATEGGKLTIEPGLELDVRDVGDGFVVLGFKDQTYRIETTLAPPSSPARR